NSRSASAASTVPAQVRKSSVQAGGMARLLIRARVSRSRIGRPSGSTYRNDLPDRLPPMPVRASLTYRRPAARAAPTGSIVGMLVCRLPGAWPVRAEAGTQVQSQEALARPLREGDRA